MQSRGTGSIDSLTMEYENSNEVWRRYGEDRRRELVETDEMEGRMTFHLNRKCPINKYFHLAERVRALV